MPVLCQFHISAYRFSWTSRGSCDAWGSDKSTVVDRTALYAFCTYRCSILRDLSSDHTLTQLQYLLICQSWTLLYKYILDDRNQYFRPKTLPYTPNAFLAHNNHHDTHSFTWLSFRPTLSFYTLISYRAYVTSGTWKTWRSNWTRNTITTQTTFHPTLHRIRNIPVTYSDKQLQNEN